MLVTVNNRLKFEIEIVHDLSCHPIFYSKQTNNIATGDHFNFAPQKLKKRRVYTGQLLAELVVR